MLKTFILSIFSIFLFSACSLKMPSFFDFEDKDKIYLEEANVCQKIEEENKKLKCYENISNKNSYAQLRLGTYYAAKKDNKKALAFLNQAKENKNYYSNLALAFLYYKGDGVEKDVNKSFELLEESSHIDPIAAYQLSRFYLQGINTKVNYKKGIELLEFAASKDVLDAQRILGNIYKLGLFEQAKDQKKVDTLEQKIKQNNEDLNLKIYQF